MKVLNELDMSNNSVKNAKFELIPTIPGGTEDNIVTIDENGQLVDSGVNISEVGGGGGDMSNYYTKAEVNAALEGKEDVINDLDDIRSGAALGATAIQSHQDISGKQDVIQYSTVPTATQELFNSGKIIQFIGSSDADYTNGYFYRVGARQPIGGGAIEYLWVPVNVQDAGSASVQADWEQDDSSAPDYIQNKPTIPDVSNFVTEDHVYEMGFATMEDIPDVSDFVTQSDVADYLGQNGYITENDVATYLSENNYVTESDIPDVSSFITENDVATYLSDNNYATQSDIPDVSDFVTESHIYEMGFATQDDISNFITESDLSDYLSNNSYATQSDIPDVSDFVTENDLSTYLYDNSYMDQSALSEYLSENDYINESNVETAIAPYISDFITDEVLVKYVTEINTKPNFATVTIEDSDTGGSYTYTIDLSSLNITGTPMVQVIYDGQVLFSDITITVDAENDEVTVTWDDTKYSVDSNNPLTVTIIGLAPVEE